MKKAEIVLIIPVKNKKEANKFIYTNKQIKRFWVGGKVDGLVSVEKSFVREGRGVSEGG